MIKLYSLAIILLLTTGLFAQIDRETRAVWVSTNFRLDWPPPTYDAEEQQQALLNILDNVERKNLNTVYFQVRFNSSVLFASNFEPWSFYLTGETGGVPSYDPLQFMIDEAHKRGLELHAWVNTVRALGGSEPQMHEYESHLTRTNADWMSKVNLDGKVSYWLDPGLPEVRNYLKDVITEIAIYYNVDGVQLDFIRYPKGGIDDEFSYSLYGENLDKDDWRRSNITSLISIIKQDLKEINPFIKLGVTPIGIYKNNGNFNGMQGYADVYQDSYTWLATNLVDYAVPQVYWNLDDNPKFESVAGDWVNNGNGNNIIIGIASYKDDVKPETTRMIDITRNLNANGVAFFRYSNIKDQSFEQFSYKSLPAEMTWKKVSSPAEPEELTAIVTDVESNKILLSWNLPEKYIYAHNIKYVALFNLSDEYDVLNSKNLFKLIPATRSKISFSISRPSQMSYYYAAKSIDNLWNESAGHTNVAEVTIPRLNTIADRADLKDKPVLVRNDKNVNYIIISSAASEEITISGTGLDETSAFVSNNSLRQGMNILTLPEELSGITKLSIEYKNSGKTEQLELQ
jgi:uncharacterized lipoprotein YddW (UPF0748 family)